MELSVFERILLLNILPREGDFKTLKVVRKLQDDTGFSEDELKALQFKQDGARTEWRREADIPKEVPIGEFAHQIIVERLKEIDKQKKLALEHLPFYERFIPEGE